MELERVKCDKSATCHSKVWLINGDSWVLDNATKHLVEHKCRDRPMSAFPETVYVGVWKNAKTGTIRYGNLNKREENARKPPDDHTEWIFLHVLCAVPDWKELPDKTTTYHTGADYGRLRRRT